MTNLNNLNLSQEIKNRHKILAYHNENHKYIKKNIDFEKGYIGRTSKKIEESLIVDFIKL